ncbi:uncharacterized protein LOC119609362 [Lucilia sericata]|uniref:uncharacterized protein LOC119609362 n=1 Tax=Lucilia sericata TaxID=13632 RepID=UPI0018A84BEA|nr:uncharacterized protein LOC119609362 [Lucilia sericata]
MTSEKRKNWKCHVCKPRSRSPTNLYQVVVFDENNQQQKQQRQDDSFDDNEGAKKYKESLSLEVVNGKLNTLQTNLQEIKAQIEMLVTSVNSLHSQMKNDVQVALSTITNSISTLVAQVNELNEKDKIKEKQINSLDTRINKIDQHMIAQNIEIKNVEDKQIKPIDVVKKIAATLNVEISERDINQAFRLRNQNNKIVVEFFSLRKKLELMSKIQRHRVDANIINNNDNNSSTTKYIYINDELTNYYRRLLWIAKTKARDAHWKYVWVRNGKIFARKSENSPSIVINNATDIESITTTVQI